MQQSHSAVFEVVLPGAISLRVLLHFWFFGGSEFNLSIPFPAQTKKSLSRPVQNVQLPSFVTL